MKTALLVLVGIVVALGIGWLVRLGLVTFTRGSVRRLFKAAPLTGIVGLMIVIVYVLVAVNAPLIAPFSEREVVGRQFAPWGAVHWLGTDNLGRDTFSRLVYGVRNTVAIALATTTLAFLIGTVLGLISATKGGWTDQLLGRAVDMLMAIPSLIFALLLLTIFGASVSTLILIIAAVDATKVYRLARNVAQNVVVMDYIEAARLRGEGFWRLIAKEILPNMTAPLVAEFGLRFCFVFLSISSLSFLGVGIQPPTADLGSMVRDNAALITFGNMTPLLPAGAIAVLAVAMNFVVDWMLHRASGLKE
jgi:peptide/nickel transport system permease protein